MEQQKNKDKKGDLKSLNKSKTQVGGQGRGGGRCYRERMRSLGPGQARRTLTNPRPRVVDEAEKVPSAIEGG